jgi:uncharacterized cupredoxin-like copper-binding protein
MEMFAFKKVLVVLVAAGLLLTACGGRRATEVKITLTEFAIESSVTDFQVGVPYHFVVTNEGLVEHEIMIMPPLAEDQMGMAMDMAALDEMALAMIEAQELQSGSTASFDYTFTEAVPAGTLEFACHTPDHYEQGMKLPLTVK